MFNVHYGIVTNVLQSEVHNTKYTQQNTTSRPVQQFPTWQQTFTHSFIYNWGSYGL